MLGRDDHERGAGVTTIGPFWDGNEVWLVAAVGVTFAAFPDWYAALLTGLYLPFVLILLALAARGVALEFRGKGGTARWRAGVRRRARGLVAAGRGAVGRGARRSSRRGLALGADGEVAGSGLGRCAGAAGVDARAARGGAGRSAPRSCWGRRSWACAPPARCGARARVAALGRRWSPAWRVLVAVVAAARAGRPSRCWRVLVAARREVLAFAAASVAVAGGVVAVFTAHLPVVLPSTLDPAWSLTVAGRGREPRRAAADHVAAVLVLPGVVAYQAFSYWVFRRRVASERVAS